VERKIDIVLGVKRNAQTGKAPDPRDYLMALRKDGSERHREELLKMMSESQRAMGRIGVDGSTPPSPLADRPLARERALLARQEALVAEQHRIAALQAETARTLAAAVQRLAALLGQASQ